MEAATRIPGPDYLVLDALLQINGVFSVRPVWAA
jgi:hypothetical protein